MTVENDPYRVLIDWLSLRGVDFQVMAHDEPSSRNDARCPEIGEQPSAKAVLVAIGARPAMVCVLKASDDLDLSKVDRLTGLNDASFVPESDLATFAPGCENGAIPALGCLFDLPTFADEGIRGDPRISFFAGSHRLSARVDRAAWERASGVKFGDLAADLATGTQRRRSRQSVDRATA